MTTAGGTAVASQEGVPIEAAPAATRRVDILTVFACDPFAVSEVSGSNVFAANPVVDAEYPSYIDDT